MIGALEDRSTLSGALWALGAILAFSLNDMLIKALSGDYPLHQVMTVRAVVAVAFLLAVVVPLSGGCAQLRTRRIGMHVLRGVFVFLANLCFFLGPRRWLAIAAGLLGVAVILRPGTEAFQPAALLPVAGALFYALLQIVTRHIGGTESAPSLAMSIQISFLVLSVLIGLALGDGRFAGGLHPSLEFLLRAWVVPTPSDLALMAAIGVMSALGGWAISQAYRVSEAAYVAAFDYAALPMAVFWGFLIFGEWPDLMAWSGIALILVSGLILIWREGMARRVPPSPHRR